MAALASVSKLREPTLDEQIQAARAEEAPRREKASQLEAALRQALADGDYGEAARLQPELRRAREALAAYEGTTTGLVHLQAAITQAEAQETRSIEEARRKAEGQRITGDAIIAQQAAKEQIAACLGRAWEHLEAAREEFRQAQAWERKAGSEHRRMLQGRVMAGEIDAMPRYIPAPNEASVLADSTPLIRELVKWAGPPVPRPPQPVATAGPSAGRRLFGGHGGGRTQPSPWPQS